MLRPLHAQSMSVFFQQHRAHFILEHDHLTNTETLLLDEILGPQCPWKGIIHPKDICFC